jgi:hypothetical protein
VVTPEAEAAITRARLVKAQALACVLMSHGASGAQVRALDAQGRRVAEQLAGVRESSDVTWAMVADIVAARGALAGRA